MNRPIAIAAGLMGLTTLVHIFAGGPDVSAPIQRSDLPDDVRAVAFVVWHTITLLLACLTVALIWLCKHENRELALITVAIQVGMAALFIGVGLYALGSLTIMPQWTVFLLVPALTVWGQTRRA